MGFLWWFDCKWPSYSHGEWHYLKGFWSKCDLIGRSVPLRVGFKVSEPHARPSASLSLAVSCQSRCGTLSSSNTTMAACACFASCIDYNGLLLTIKQFFTRLILPIQIWEVFHLIQFLFFDSLQYSL